MRTLNFAEDYFLRNTEESLNWLATLENNLTICVIILKNVYIVLPRNPISGHE